MRSKIVRLSVAACLAFTAFTVPARADAPYEYVVIGSGAGGGPVACRLALKGHRVLVLEAGDDQGATQAYQVPAFHPQASESEGMRWDYFVRHYDDQARAGQDTKKRVQDGEARILYPRAGTLGGCTAHNAMITVQAHASDWDHIAELTGDASWRAESMRHYLDRVAEWLPTELADSTIAIKDTFLSRFILGAAAAFSRAAGGHGLASLEGDARELVGLLRRDVNAAPAPGDAGTGLFQIPLATRNGQRRGTRDYLLEIQRGLPDLLTIRTGALATRIVFADAPDADGRLRATGVAFLTGAHLYRADPRSGGASPRGPEEIVTATREVIVSAGAFNSPQLLKLSGVGPRAELERLKIPVRLELPGVGGNLQDRYEVGVVSALPRDISALKGLAFGASEDDALKKWRTGKGVYTTNGGVVGVILKSSPAVPDPDLFVFGLPGSFKGYEPGYSKSLLSDTRHFTWAVLKAHTQNRGGAVTLRSADPRDMPDIAFRYFDEGTNAAGEARHDLDAMRAGVAFARQVLERTRKLMLPILESSRGESIVETVPGPDVQTPAQVETFVRNEAWGHHASCTCPIGADGDPAAVLDSKFRVLKTRGLRVVDASVFPRIPGFFIALPTYMISEKAAEAILEDASR